MSVRLSVCLSVSVSLQGGGGVQLLIGTLNLSGFLVFRHGQRLGRVSGDWYWHTESVFRYGQRDWSVFLETGTVTLNLFGFRHGQQLGRVYRDWYWHTESVFRHRQRLGRVPRDWYWHTESLITLLHS